MRLFILCVLTLLQFRATCQTPADTMVAVKYEKPKVQSEDADRYFASNIVYPFNSSKQTYDEGRVVLTFIVKKNGQIDSIKIVEMSGEPFKTAVLNVLKMSKGLWTPGEIDDMPVDKKYVGSIIFTTSKSIFSKAGKGMEYFENGKYEKALSYINEALIINPYDINLYRTRASIFNKQNNTDLENSDLKKVAELEQDLLLDISLTMFGVKR